MSLLRKMSSVVASFFVSSPEAPRYLMTGAPAWSGESVTERTALSLSAVWACVNLLSGLQASMPLHFYRPRRDGSRETCNDHPVAMLLRDSPNAEQSAFEFWQFMTAVLELRGNAYAIQHRNGLGGLVALEPVEVPVHVTRAVGGGLQYEFTQAGQSYKLGSADVLHIRGFMPTLLGGLSTLEYARHTFGAAIAAERTVGETFRNGLRPSGVLAFKEWLSPDNRVVAETALVDKFAGAQNAGRPMVTEGGVEWKPLAITPVDAEMLASRVFGVEEICRFYGTPPFLIGHTQKTTSFGAGVEQQMLGFTKTGLTPRLRRVEGAIVRRLLSPAERAGGMISEYAMEGLLRGDSKARAEFYRVMIMIGAMTVNEVRALENMPPVPGGDVPRVQMQNVPLTQVDALAEASVQAQTGQGSP